MTNWSLLGFWFRFNSIVNCESLTVATLPETVEGSGEFRRGSASAISGTDQSEIVKHKRKKVPRATAVRKRMMKDTSRIMSFNWVVTKGHAGCQRNWRSKSPGCKEKK